jgi:hypothetical protein
VPLKTTIDGTVADDIELLCKWSENDTSYVVNHLLRFALSQSEDFEQHKRSLEASPSSVAVRPAAETATPLVRSTEAGR